jgi:putative ABC transport system ATP-binding protein
VSNGPILSILGCILSPDRGRLEVLGRDVGSMGPDGRTAFRRGRIAFVFQNFHLFPTLSALDNLRLALSLQGISYRASSTRDRGLAAGRAGRSRPAAAGAVEHR